MYTGGVLAVQARLEGHPQILNFILDTGSGGISLDSATCEDLGMVLRQTDTVVNGIAGAVKVRFAFNQVLHTGNVATDHLNFYVNDYSLLTSTYGEKVDGIIGFSFLSRYILDVDFDSLQVKMYSPGKYSYERKGKLFKPSFKRLAAQTVAVKDNRKTAFKFYFDSGAGLCMLMSERFLKDSSVINPKRKPVITQAEGLGGKKSMQLTVVKYIKLGPFKFRNVPVHLYNDDNDIFSYPYAGGLLGNDLLRRFNIVFNYPAGEVQLTPNSHYSEPFDYAYTGMSLYAIEEKIYIDDIVAGSPAFLAELKNGDELVSVAGNISNNVQEYKNLLQKTDIDIRLIIKRKDKMLFKTIHPVSIR